jgi:hypothetical protein
MKDNIMKMAIISILSFSLLIMGCPDITETENPDPPVISGLSIPPTSVTPTDTVTVSATVKTTTSTITKVVLQWTLDGTKQTDKDMTKSGNVYSAEIPAQDVDSVVTYKVSATNNLNKTKSTATQSYTVAEVPVGRPVISNLSREPTSVTPSDTVKVSATVTSNTASAISTVVLQWTLDNVAQTPDINMTKNGNVYSAVIPKQVLGAVVTYKVSATNALGTNSMDGQPYTVGSVSGSTDYTKLKLNEVSGIGEDGEKFYELINIGAQNIPLEGCKIYYNANGSIGGTLPTGKGSLTWTGVSAQTIEAGKFFILGRGTAPGSFTTGLTATRILIITLEDPDGNEIDKCVRTADTEDYAINDKSFSRIPDGTGPFYFTWPATRNETNGTSTAGLTKLPDPPIISDFGRTPASVILSDTVTVSAAVTTTSSTITTVVLQWTLGGTKKDDINMTKGSGDVYSAVIPAQASGSVVTYKVFATNNHGETNSSDAHVYTVVSVPIDYTKLKLNEVSGIGTDSSKFYELINTGAQDIPLYNCKIWYNANSAIGGTLPTGKGSLTWTGSSDQTIEAGKFIILRRGTTPGSFTTGLTAERILIITLEDPAGIVIDRCVRTSDTGNYAFTLPFSFSRIPDGEGPFYFTPSTPNKTNNDLLDLLAEFTKLPVAPVISGLNRTPSSVTPSDTVTVSATVEPVTASAIPTVVIKWSLGGIDQSDIPMTKGSGDVYSAEIPAQAVGSAVTYKVSASDAPGETNSSVEQNYKVVSAGAAVDYTKLVLNEVSGNKKFVEIYNSGAVAIPMEGVKIQRNDGQSQWVGAAGDSIPAGAYRLFLFFKNEDDKPDDLASNPAYKGWDVSSGISNQQILKVAIIDPAGNPIDVFIRGDIPLSSWGTGGAEQENTYSYSRMDASTWAYAAPTPGLANGPKAADIVNPGYLTAQP